MRRFLRSAMDSPRQSLVPAMETILAAFGPLAADDADATHSSGHYLKDLGSARSACCIHHSSIIDSYALFFVTVRVTDAFLASLLAMDLGEPDLVNQPVSLVPLSWCAH